MSAKTKATAAEAASLKRLIERYDRPGARERGLQILAREMDAATEIKKLGAQFEAAWKQEREVPEEASDEELEAACDRTFTLVDKILACPATGLLMMRLKARAYLCCEAKTLDDLAEGAAVASDKVLVSLLRDLGADRALAQEEEASA